MESLFRLRGERVIIRVKVRPSAGRNQVVGAKNGELVVRIKAPPEKGKANKELISFLAKTMGVARREMALIKGMTSAHKVVSAEKSCLPYLETLTEPG